MLYWSYVSIKKFPPLLDCFQFVKLARILFESPLLAPGESRLVVWYGFGVFLLNWIYLVGGCCPLYFRPSVTWAGHKASTLSIVVTNACHYCDTVAMEYHITLSNYDCNNWDCMRAWVRKCTSKNELWKFYFLRYIPNLLAQPLLQPHINIVQCCKVKKFNHW